MSDYLYNIVASCSACLRNEPRYAKDIILACAYSQRYYFPICEGKHGKTIGCHNPPRHGCNGCGNLFCYELLWRPGRVLALEGWDGSFKYGLCKRCQDTFRVYLPRGGYLAPAIVERVSAICKIACDSHGRSRCTVWGIYALDTFQCPAELGVSWQ